MADTFVLTDSPVVPSFSMELPNTAVTGHPYLSHTAPLALFNPTGSGKIVKIKKATIHPLLAQTSGGPFAYELQPITAHTVSQDVIAATSMDSNNAALPSQVVLCRSPGAVTTSGGPLDSMFKNSISTNMSRTSGTIYAISPWSHWLARQDAGTAEKQRITLREGQGLSLRLTNNAAYAMASYRMTLVVRVVATGACHTYSFDARNIGYPVWSLMNGSGSGVVLEVVSFSDIENGTDELPVWALEPIDGLDSATGDAMTPTPMDSTASIGSVFARKNAAYQMKGAKSGALISVPHEHWQVPSLVGIGPNFANLSGVTARYAPVNPRGSEFDIVLREGDGIAFTKKNASALDANTMALTFTVESASVGGGGNTYSRSRVTNA